MLAHPPTERQLADSSARADGNAATIEDAGSLKGRLLDLFKECRVLSRASLLAGIRPHYVYRWTTPTDKHYDQDFALRLAQIRSRSSQETP